MLRFAHGRKASARSSSSGPVSGATFRRNPAAEDLGLESLLGILKWRAARGYSFPGGSDRSEDSGGIAPTPSSGTPACLRLMTNAMSRSICRERGPRR